jgi:GntR family transcriptional regulator
VILLNPSGGAPLWKQVEDGVRAWIATGALAPGASAPSVRELARDLRINPATVARAYQRLVEAGLLSIRRGEGTFVSEAPPSLPRGEKNRILREGADRYAALGRTVGADPEQAIREVAAAFDRLQKKEGEGR